ncbi:MAG: uracil-DNA glycosylase [Chloroflexi bacterium]|nr:uracil-DNA glycosylase [Chloroflexota bacterium]
MSLDERRAALDVISKEVRACAKCELHSGRTLAVPGAGRPDAELMFIGEGPGYHEDQQGLPFVGASGKYLGELLALIGLTRNDVFITNVIKCRPPANRDPLPGEIDTCVPAYLNRQIEIINPKIIATLGRFSMGLFFPPDTRITKVHGQPKRADGRIYFPLFHPAAVLRNLNLRPAMEEDFKRIKTLLTEAQQQAVVETPKPDDDPPFKQLSLF